MSTSLPDLIASLTAVGGEAAAAAHDRFASDLAALLAARPLRGPEFDAWRAALTHGFNYYYWQWDKRAVQHLAGVEAAIATWAGYPDIETDLLCELLDFHYFLCWCFSASSTDQCRAAMPAMQAAAAAFGRGARPPPYPPLAEPVVHVVWLAMFASWDSPMSVSVRHVAPALRRFPERFRLTVVAWRDVQPAFVAWLREQGATCHVLAAPSPTATIAAIEALVAADPASIAISDMNNAVPTALFARRLAPAQVFLQAGMPVWPVRPLDGVLNCFGFDPVTAGWGAARLIPFLPPWDLEKLAPPVNAEEVAQQRARLPAGMRLIGNYGRLVKLAEPCMQAVEQILMRCPDVAFATGGTGDSAALHAFVRNSPVGDRMHIIEGFVPGHSWGRMLDVFLDTWPVTGGESCRETIAKGRPVVSILSDEMPAIFGERDPDFVARDWPEYVEIAVRLLTDPAAYADACARSLAFAQSRTDREGFANQFAAELEHVLADVHDRSTAGPLPGKAATLWSSIRGKFGRSRST